MELKRFDLQKDKNIILKIITKIKPARKKR